MGGIFDVLELIYQQMEKNGNVEFSKEDVVEITGLSATAVSKNLLKLEKNGFLKKKYCDKGAKKALFTLRGEEVGNFIIECLRR